MKLLLDQNLCRRLVRDLADAFPGAQHVSEPGLDQATDSAIWSYAQSHGLVILPKDADFQQRALLHGAPPKVVWIRPGNCSTGEISTLLRTRRGEIGAFVADPAAALLALA
jgi:predicted nuclease of predicted toxin-antitoxin system